MSNSLQLLLSENERLSQELRVQWQRVAQLEDELKAIKKQYQVKEEECLRLKESLRSFEMKEKIWREEGEKLQTLNHNMQVLTQELQEERKKKVLLERYVARIRQVIVPWVRDGKALLEKKEREKENLQKNQDSLLLEIISLKEKCLKIEERYQTLLDQSRSLLEQDKLRLQKRIEELELDKAKLSKKADLCDVAMIRQNELENELILLRRRHEDETIALRQEIVRLKAALRSYSLSFEEENPESHNEHLHKDEVPQDLSPLPTV